MELLSLVSIVLAFFAWPTSTNAQADMGKGVVIEKVVCANDPSQSYALYLPSKFSNEKSWPILYAFDPLARGRVPVERFKEAAERFGYILAGSNNSRNGIGAEELTKAVNSMLQDTHERFPIDKRRIYATGFSGGARVANRLASSCNGCIAGVISCGAGFPLEIRPTSTLPYVFLGTIGIDDFNFREMRPLGLKLSALGVISRVVTFQGAHQWPPKETAMVAVEWMELQAMKTSRRSRDETIVENALAHSAAELKRLDASIDLVDRFILLGAIINDFRGVRDVSAYERELSELKDSKRLKTALADERRQLEKEQEKTNGILSLGRELRSNETHDLGLARVRATLKPLFANSNSEVDGADRRIARRTLGQVFAVTFEAALYDYLPKRRYDLAVASLEIAAEAAPTYANVELQLARALILRGSRDGAIAALRRAVEKGFADSNALEKDDAFARLRGDKRFKEIVEVIKAKQNSKVPPPAYLGRWQGALWIRVPLERIPAADSCATK